MKIIKNVQNIMKIYFHYNAMLGNVGTKKKKKTKIIPLRKKKYQLEQKNVWNKKNHLIKKEIKNNHI